MSCRTVLSLHHCIQQVYLHVNHIDSVEDTWVGCASCDKWRMLPPDITAEEVDALPEVWYCRDK